MSILKRKQRPDAKDENLKPNQDLATAFDIQLRNKRKKMAKGGMVKEEEHLESSIPPASDKEQPKQAYNEKQSPITSREPPKESEHEMLFRHEMEKHAFYAAGGEVDSADVGSDESGAEDGHPGSIAEAIMKKHAKGGMISSDSNDEGPGTRIDFNEAAKKENYSDSDEDFSYSDDGEDGDSREKDSENKNDGDMVSKIMKKRRS